MALHIGNATDVNKNLIELINKLSKVVGSRKKNNRMGKTRDLFKKINDTKGTFHAKMSTTKDRNCMDLTEAEYTKKRWQEYKKLYKKRS